LGYHVGHQESAAVIGFIAGAVGAWCNVSPVVAASRVIVGADFVLSIREGIIWAEVVLAIGCPNPRAVRLTH